ncbi:PilW family protein [Pseudomonas sp. HUK17]|uniref:PilW family protein n=1 Tax=Pseudomonas sp. HUK17 TaxID=1799359 RepID=UPI000799BAAB|nr:PilW family protein [Pseudomonas sp. HUK17]KXJ32825.1 hypothetical protein AX284_10235 [Pseudomonas sp. HUK17]
MMRSRSRHQVGLSIIELMIALLLGLLLMGGVIQIFLSSRQTYQTNVALSQVQESGRFALEFIAFDLRNAGYKGECLSKLNDLTPTSLTSGNDDRYVLGSGLKGWNDSSPGTLPDWLDTTYNARTSGTDVILLKHAANPVVKALPDNAAATNGSLTTGTTDSGARKGDLIIVADPVACDFFINQSDTGKSVSLKEGLNFSRAYNKTAQALNYQSTLYYLKNDTTTGVPSLWRTRYTSNAGSTPVEIAEELVSGIQDLQFQYALGNANGQITGNYLDANDSSLTNNWQSVVSVRINLLAVSRQKNAITPDQTVPFMGSNRTIDDGRLAQVFTLTVGIRNHLP